MPANAPLDYAHPEMRAAGAGAVPGTDVSVRQCRTCCETIPLGARKCKYCLSYQGWRGWLSISNTSLALLVALISVITTAVPVVTNIAEQPREGITVSMLGTEASNNILSVSNAGTAPGIIE